MIEEWHDVVGYEGVYSVSSLGRVRRDSGSNGTWAGKILKPGRGRHGRLMVVLHWSGKRWPVSVHRLVAIAFLGPRPSGLHINHKDYDYLNNSVSNLEYVTASYNMRHAYDNGKVGPAGERHGLAVLTDKAVAAIRKSSLSLSRLANIHGASVAAISLARNRKTWKHVK